MQPLNAGILSVLVFSYDHTWCMEGILKFYVPALQPAHTCSYAGKTHVSHQMTHASCWTKKCSRQQSKAYAGTRKMRM